MVVETTIGMLAAVELMVVVVTGLEMEADIAGVKQIRGWTSL